MTAQIINIAFKCFIVIALFSMIIFSVIGIRFCVFLIAQFIENALYEIKHG